MNPIEEHAKAIRQLCESHHVKSLYAFGSVLTEAFGVASDVDLVVDFTDEATNDYADNYFELKFSLQNVLQRTVDLLEERAIRNPFFKEALQQQRQLIYER